MTTSTTPPTSSAEAAAHRQLTGMLHSLVRSHASAAAKPRNTGFNATQTQRNADLVQALQRAQRNS